MSGDRCRVRRPVHSVLCREHRLRGRVRSTDEVRWDVGLEAVIGLLVSIGLLGYLIVAMVKPEKF